MSSTTPACYFDPEQSMKAETDLIHENRRNNIEKDYHHVFGDPEKGFAEADYVAEGRYIANEVTHARWSRTARWRISSSIRTPASWGV